MGTLASKLSAIVGRPLKNYNVESRAFKVISKEKPTPAPTYPSLEKVMREIKNDPDLLNKGKLSAEEIKNLSQVYVTSTGDNPVIKSREKLPADRHTHDEFLYGYQEPVRIPPGRVSLRQLLEVLDKYAADPVKNSSEVLAAEYKLDLKTTESLLEYFTTFRVYLQPEGEKPGKLERARDLLVKPWKYDDNKSKKLPRLPRK